MLIPAIRSAPRWRVGQARVDASTREIRMPGARRAVRVTPKALAVLRVLSVHAGEVVTRQALLDEVWAATLPTDDVLTQAITQLRKAFGSGTGGMEEGRAYIETIAKSGYRLMRDVGLDDDRPEVGQPVAGSPPSLTPEPAPDSGPEAGGEAASARTGPDAAVRPGPPPQPVATRRWPAPVRLVLAGLLVAGIVGVAFVLWRLYEPQGVQTTYDGEEDYRLITSTLGFNTSPTLSPDGQRVAYVAYEPGAAAPAIVVQPARSAAPERLTPGRAGASESQPRWSPDGRDIAFLRRTDDGSCAVVVAAANGGGAEREVQRCDGATVVSFDWTPDGRGLVFGTLDGSRPAAGIRVLDLGSGTWEAIDYEIEPGAIDHAPRYSPDGEWILFARNPHLGDLWRVPAKGGRAERLTSLLAELRGWAWSSADIVVFGRRVDMQSRLYSLDLKSGAVTDLGLDDAQAPDVAAATGALAFVHRRPRFGLFRITTDGVIVRKERIFASSGRDHMPVVSPDGRWLAFASDRAGAYELWVAPLAPEGDPRPVEGLKLEGSQPPTWSPDGRRLVAAGMDRATPGRTVLHEVDVATLQARPLPLPDAHPLQGALLGNGRLLVGAESADGSMQLSLYELRQGKWERRGRIPDVSQFRYDAGRERVLFSRLTADGLWEATPDLASASVRRVDARHPERRAYRSWSLAEDDALDLIEAVPGCMSQLSRLAADGAGFRVCLADDRLSADNGFSSDRRGVVYAAIAVDDGTDIGFTHLVPREELPLEVVKRLIFKAKVSS